MIDECKRFFGIACGDVSASNIPSDFTQKIKDKVKPKYQNIFKLDKDDLKLKLERLEDTSNNLSSLKEI